MEARMMESGGGGGDGGGTRPAKGSAQEKLNCPRCKSGNTKFCYYNNYSLTQPRYFCKACRRYWTDGGSLRNIPVGGGSRKNRKLGGSGGGSGSGNPEPVNDLNLGFVAVAAAAEENSGGNNGYWNGMFGGGPW